MDDNSLSDYRSDVSQLEDEDQESSADIQATMYHQEVNTLKIEKLSQRVTIISVIIPCIIIAVLAFAYIDMKERVVDVDQTQGSQVAKIEKALEEKLNALDVRIAKATFDLDEKLVQVEQKSQALENQAAKMSSSKVDLKAMEKALAKLDKRIKTNAAQDKSTLAAMERINTQLLAAIKENNTGFKSNADKIKAEIQLFKEEFDARLLELSAYEQQIARLSKEMSLLDKQLKTLKQDTQLSFDKKLDQLRLSLEKKIIESKAKPTSASQSSKKAATPKAAEPKPPAAATAAPTPKTVPPKPAAASPSPQTPPTTDSEGISEQTLTQ